MIVWFNCKITDVRLHPQFTVRYNLRSDNRFDTARYSFASFAPLEPLVTKFIFNLEMADGFTGREQDMQQWLEGIFPKDKLSLHWHRCNTLEQWQEVKTEMDLLDDPLIFPAANEDHIFMDTDIELFRKGLELLKSDPNPHAALMTSHYPESIRAAWHFGASLSEDGEYVSYYTDNNDAIRVIKREYFQWYLDNFPKHISPVFRTENWNSVGLLKNKMYVPLKEQFRHFDGYNHVGIGPDTAPPLQIPPGFFERDIIIRYGFDDYDEAAVNINPLKNLHTADPSGTDYKFTLDDIPVFWVPRITDTQIAEGIDHQAVTEARDQHLIAMTRIKFNWPHMGVTFNEYNTPPLQWIQQHMIVTEFVVT